MPGVTILALSLPFLTQYPKPLLCVRKHITCLRSVCVEKCFVQVRLSMYWNWRIARWIHNEFWYRERVFRKLWSYLNFHLNRTALTAVLHEELLKCSCWRTRFVQEVSGLEL